MTMTTTLNEHYSERHAKADAAGIASGCDEPLPGTLTVGDRFLLVQEGRHDGRIWLSVHQTMVQVLSYVEDEEGADDWTTVELIDLYVNSAVTPPHLPTVWRVLGELADYVYSTFEGTDAPATSAADRAQRLDEVLEQLGLADGMLR